MESLETASNSSLQQAELPLWHVILIEVIALLFQAVLLLILYILLRRQIANYYCQTVKAISVQVQTQAPKKPEGNHDLSALKKTGSKRNVTGPALSYKDEETEIQEKFSDLPNVIQDNDSGSDSDSSSHSSDSSERYPPASNRKALNDMNYSTLVFPASVSRTTLSLDDYENIKAAGDYVNVDPKNRMNNAWNFSNSFSSEPVEYTEVAM